MYVCVCLCIINIISIRGAEVLLNNGYRLRAHTGYHAHVTVAALHGANEHVARHWLFCCS